ncbi:MAG: hypothetical protein WBR26_07740 [Candidatus Acidiferrum sp.]
MGNITSYEIFSGSLDKDALWLESVEGLDAACDRMNKPAAQCPGPYCVFSISTGKVLASVDTSQHRNVQRDDKHLRESA